MKLATALVLALMLLPAGVRGQVPAPSPTPHAYDDPAMHFNAPANYFLIASQQLPLSALTDDPQTVAVWLAKGSTSAFKMVLQQQSFTNTLSSFEAVIEQQVRDSADDAVVRSKDRIALKNGMPAYFITIVAGTGFTTTKAFIVLWIDGERGCAIVLRAQLGDMDPVTAKSVFSDLSAVQYPSGRDQ